MNDVNSDPRTYSVAEAAASLEELVWRVVQARERVTITDESGASAVLISRQELDDLEHALALAEYRTQFVGVPAEQGKISDLLGRDQEDG